MQERAPNRAQNIAAAERVDNVGVDSVDPMSSALHGALNGGQSHQQSNAELTNQLAQLVETAAKHPGVLMEQLWDLKNW